MNVPCITLQVTILNEQKLSTLGTNELVGTDPAKTEAISEQNHEGEWKQYQGIPLWDGKTLKDCGYIDREL